MMSVNLKLFHKNDIIIEGDRNGGGKKSPKLENNKIITKIFY